ncbi:MAG: type II secretion system ATPase GspE [Zetaproteobacteria bacterium]|nr:type II secretion system ATPase GspE [Zetaproteobacteria bacterium]
MTSDLDHTNADPSEEEDEKKVTPLPVDSRNASVAADNNSRLKQHVSGGGLLSRSRRKSIGELLIESTQVTEEQIEEALQNQVDTEDNRKIGEILVDRELITEEEMLRALAYQLDLPYYEKLPINDINPQLVTEIPIQFARDNQILPVARDEFNVTIAVADPLNIFPLDDLRLILSTNVNIIVAPPTVIQHSINRVYERSNDASQKVVDELNVPDIGAGEDDLEETRDLLDSTDDEKPIIKLVNTLLSRAVKEGTSDIHIEPYENEIVVRFRIDGTLHDKMQLPKRHLNSVVSRIKIIGKLNIAEKRVPQDGRISIKVAGKDADVRLSVLPTAHGERVVMRILDKSAGVKRLDQMGFDPDVYRRWSQLVSQKHGILLVTGPTGSGKTTLLYASVVHINTTDINILTIEHPVEYKLPGIGQIDVKEKVGLTFSEGLRAILRQDPDVIMVGEIRDRETAEIAVQSSLTGHLVFSTLHTNDAASTITRLDDLGVQPFQIASAVLGVLATRLIRRLCGRCREKHVLNEEEIKLMDLTPADVEGKDVYKAGRGCEACHGQAYAGRIGIHELLIMDDDMKTLVMKSQDSNEIRKQAMENGMKTLRQSAVHKVLEGLTSLDEAIQKTQSEDVN